MCDLCLVAFPMYQDYMDNEEVSEIEIDQSEGARVGRMVSNPYLKEVELNPREVSTLWSIADRAEHEEKNR